LRAQLGQAEEPGFGVFAGQPVHEVDQLAFRAIQHQYCLLDIVILVKKVGVVRIEDPVRHWPGHLRKARHEVMCAERETGYAVDRVGNQRRALREIRHQHPFGISAIAELSFDLGYGAGMALDRQAGCRCCCLPGTVIRRGADAAEAENDVASRHAAAQHFRDAVFLVADVFCAGELQAACFQSFYQPFEVCILPSAGKDFIADDDGAELRLFNVGIQLPVSIQFSRGSLRATTSRLSIGCAVIILAFFLTHFGC